MIGNHFKIAWRNLFKHKFHTLLNVVGLVCGTAFVLLIAAYIWQQYQVNSDLRNRDNQYALQSEYREAGMGLALTTAGPLPKALKEEYPHLVANYYRIDGINCIVSNGDAVYEEEAALGDSTLLSMYGFQLLDGDVTSALEAPFSAVITAPTAIKYFGEVNVVGRSLAIRNFAGEKRDFAITGVLKPTAKNSVINLTADMDNTIFLPRSNAPYFGRQLDNWQNLWIAGFVELQEGVSPDQLIQPLKELVNRHADERVAANLTPILKPLRTYYLEDNNGAVRKMILTLSFVAVFILLMAIINFVNISVSQSISRLKEIGVRKIMGSSRMQLIGQLALESMVIVCLAAIIALALYPLLSPLFANIMSNELPALSDLPLYFFGHYIAGTLLLGILAGIYPALRLSGNHLLHAVKGRLSGIGEKHLVRKALLCIQFAVAMVVLIAAVVISRQVSVFFSGELGYDKDYLIMAQVPRDWTPEGLNRMETIRKELASIPQVENSSISYDVPGAAGSGAQQITNLGAEGGTVVQVITSDEYYADTYRIPLLAGDFFSPVNDLAYDPQKIVINKKAAEALGYTVSKDAIGQPVSMYDGAFTATIAGVTEDFYLTSMHSATPAIAWLNVKSSSAYRFFTIRLQPGSIAGSMAAVQKKWKQLMPDAPFEYRFMDETLNKMYAAEVQLKKASTMATIVSIIVVMLGIIGLVSLAIQQRVKEIGIRKVLGASLANITGLFVKDFLWVYLVALLVACPVAYLLMQQWLANYFLKANLGVLVFLLPVVLLSTVVLVFISFQTARAARANPVDSLRDE